MARLRHKQFPCPNESQPFVTKEVRASSGLSYEMWARRGPNLGPVSYEPTDPLELKGCPPIYRIKKRCTSLLTAEVFGAGDGFRTHDLVLGKDALYH